MMEESWLNCASMATLEDVAWRRDSSIVSSWCASTATMLVVKMMRMSDFLAGALHVGHLDKFGGFEALLVL